MAHPSVLLAGAALLLGAARAPAQTTWHVDLNGTPPGSGTLGDPYTSIQHAIDQLTTADGDTLLVAPGTYVETIDYLRKSIVVRSSAGPTATTIQPASPADPIVVELGTVSTLEGFTVRRDGAPTGYGIAVLVANDVGTVRRCIVTGHDVGIANAYDVVVESSTVSLNRRGINDIDSGIHFVQDTIAWDNTISDIRAGVFGGLIVRYSDVGVYEFTGPCGAQCPGNIQLDPTFWDPAGDFHLRLGSPCIDAGNPAGVDPDGSRRDIGAIPYEASWAPGTQAFCFGSDALCPCANGGSGAGGCDLPQGTGGVVLAIEDFAPNGAGGGSAAIVGSGYPPAAQPGVTLIRSPGVQDPPLVFGDGLRCIAASGLVRIGAVLAQGGASLHSINHGAGAGTFRYQLWTRSTPSTFCDPAAAFNLSNALEVAWP